MADEAVPNQPAPPSDGSINPAQPSPSERSETSRLEKKKKLVLRQGGEDAAGETAEIPGPGETSSTPLVDPTRRRDTNTASLKRLRPQETDGGTTTVDQDTSETVNIKVIKEQKKQFRNMMTSSQTLRVKPEDAAQAPELATPPSQSAAGAEDAKRTLKIKSAGEADPRTERIARTATVAPASMPTTETPAVAAPAAASPKSTLKIKAPPGIAPAQASGPKPGATLKIKAPAPAAAPAPASAAQTQPGQPAAPAATIRQAVAPDAAKAGKTLKLRSGTPPAAGQAQAAAAPATEAPAGNSLAVPGIGYLLPAVASLGLIITAIVYGVKSAQGLFDGSLF